jgi:hypothetical protein
MKRAGKCGKHSPALTQPIPNSVKRKELTMQEDPNTDNTDDQIEEPTLDCGDWKLAFEAFEGHPYAASRMGFNIRWLRKRLDAQLFKPQSVMDSFDVAMEVLFPYTEFHETSFELFLKFTDAELTYEEEKMLKALGVKSTI